MQNCSCEHRNTSINTVNITKRYERVIRNRKSKKRERIHWPKEQTLIYKTPQKTKDRTTRAPLKPVVNAGVPEELTVPVSRVASVVIEQHGPR